MARGRTWTEAEDAAILSAAAENARHGIKGFRPGDIEAGRRETHGKAGHMNRLQDVAERFGRSYVAVRKRAQRIGAASYGAQEREDNR